MTTSLCLPSCNCFFSLCLLSLFFRWNASATTSAFFTHPVPLPLSRLPKVKYLNYQVGSSKVAMPEDSEAMCMCPLQGMIDIIGKKWALLIVNAIGNHRKLRFNKIMKELRGVSPRTLTETLKELQHAGLIQREFFNEIPPRVEYSLTEDGVELRRAIIPLLRWALARTHESFISCGANTPTTLASHK